MINRYNNFLIESILNNILLESKLILMRDFISVIVDINSDTNEYPSTNRIAKFLLNVSNKDINIAQNFIDIDKECDKVSFVPDNRIDRSNGDIYCIEVGSGETLGNIVSDYSYQLDRHPLLAALGIPKVGLYQPRYLTDIPSNKWRLVKTYNGADAGDGFKKYILHHLQNIDDNEYYIVVLDNLIDNTFGMYPYHDISNLTKGKVKIGRFLNKLLDAWFSENDGDRNDYTASDIEKFVNVYTSKVLFNNNIMNSFEVVSGEDIRKWYLLDNYASTLGQLGSSCMRYNECQKYLDIYVDNPEVCQLLILKKDDKILGRTLLWTDIDGKKWMDRVYTYKDNYKNLFNNWCIKNNYTTIYDTTYKATIKLKGEDYDHYPYMDTFSYFKSSEDSGAPGQTMLSNFRPERPFIILQETNGNGNYFN